MNKLVTFTSLFLCLGAANAQLPELTTEQAALYFKEVKTICDRDNGKLWGKNLWAPTLFINPIDYTLIANEQDANGEFSLKNGIYTGSYPKDKIIANSTTTLNGKSWVMVVQPLPDDEYTRNQLVVHEMFHYLQDILGLSSGSYNNNHLDEMDARIYLKLEWAALNKAIEADNPQSAKEAIKDAIIFRTYRRSLYPNVAKDENMFEVQEGLAEYTSHKLCSNTHEEFKQHVLRMGKMAWNNESFVRSFGYYSGLAYAYLLDGGDWQKCLKYDTDLAALLKLDRGIEADEQQAESLQLQRRSLYGYDSIYATELALKQKKDEAYAVNKQKFVEGETLTINLLNPNVGFDPNNLQAFGNAGTVYPTINLLDSWGSLVVDGGGCLLSNDWRTATLSAKNISYDGVKVVKGDGWELVLNGGYRLVKEEKGYIIRGE